MILSAVKFISINLLFITCTNIIECESLRILGLFPVHVRSHFIMCEELMRELAARGHQVDVYSHFPLKKPIPNYRDFSLQGSMTTVSNNVSFDFASISSPSESLGHWLKTYGKPMCDLMELPVFQKLLQNPPNDPPYDLVINELCLTNCYIPWGRYLNVPFVGVVTPPLLDWMFTPFATPINLATDPSIYSPYAAPMTFSERLGNFMIYHSITRTFHKYVRIQDESIKKIFGPTYPNSMDLMKEVSLVLVNHDHAISGLRPFSPMVVPVGGLHVVDHNETLPEVVRKWLDESEHGCIYFSFGSMTRFETFPKPSIDAFYKSFKNIAPTRVLLKVAKPEELPPNLPANVLVQPWFPQMQVLKHKNIKLFVTHGGLMGTQEAIYFGVPLVVVPIFGDQKFNAQTYVKNKFAIKVDLEEITEKTFTDALKEILNNPTYKKAAQRISSQFRDRPMSPLDTAIFWIKYVHKHGKDALRSPALDMPWWQVSLLDVYGFIATVLVLVTYITIKVIRTAISWLINKASPSSQKLKSN